MDSENTPSVLRDSEFTEDGYVKTDSGILVPAYAAGERGFQMGDTEKLNEFYDRLREEAHMFALCPFDACGEQIGPEHFNKERPYGKVLKSWREFNRNVGKINYGDLMPNSKLMVAVGKNRQLDVGVAAEIAYYAEKLKRPIAAIKTDRRLEISPFIRHYLGDGPSEGAIFSGDNPIDDAMQALDGDDLSWTQSERKEKPDWNLTGEFKDNGMIRFEGNDFFPMLVLSDAGYDLEDREELNGYCEEFLSNGIFPLWTFRHERFGVVEGDNISDEYGKLDPYIFREELAPRSLFALSLLDGSHTKDPEVCAEIASYSVSQGKPIIGVGSDIRLADNVETPVNPAVGWFFWSDKFPDSKLFVDPQESYERGFREIQKIADRIRSSRM